jgi:nitrogen fixation/metabolism regulation signal transduction histidine kinase
VVEINTTAGNLNISGDQTRLIRVFLNVIKNIYESYDELEDDRDRYLHIQISEDQEHNILKIMFIDNAKGFSSEVGENFFRRGFTTKQNGLGIGLHECRDIIESHGGEIKLESKGENSGAMTIITFPLSDK